MAKGAGWVRLGFLFLLLLGGFMTEANILYN